MKKGVVLLIVLVVAIAVLPFGFSFWAESRLNNVLKDFNEAGVVEFTVLKIDRGWFSSEATIVAELAAGLSGKVKELQQMGDKGETPRVVLNSTIHHGPFPLTGSGFSAVPVVAIVDTKLMKSVGESEPLLAIDYTLLTTLALMGKNHIKVDIPEWNGPMGEGEANIQWKGLTSDFSFADGLQAADVKMDAPYLEIKGKDGNMLIESLKVDSNSEVGIEGLSLGSATFTIGKLSVLDEKAGADFSLNDINIAAKTTASGDNIDSTVEFNIAGISLTGESFGPGVFTMAFRNLDAGAIARISNKYKEMSNQPDMPPEQMNMMMSATLFSEMSALLEKGPEIEIGELSLSSTKGKLMGTARVTVDNSKPEMLSNPMLIKDAIIGEVDLEIPMDLMVSLNMAAIRQEFKSVNIEYTEEQLQTMAKSRVEKRFAPLVAGNIFTRIGDMYKFSASFKEGMPVVNGKPFQIPFGGAPAQQ
jgi:uncharacterized protein YdgA (DUF945 family)